VGLQHRLVATSLSFYKIRIKGRLGATALSAFQSMECELRASETVLSGWLEDQSAVFGVLAQIEALGLVLIELRQVHPEASMNPPDVTGAETRPPTQGERDVR